MLTISKIVSCKFVETLQELLYTALANNFSNSAPAYTRNTMSPVLFLSDSESKEERVTKVKAPVIFMVLLGLVIFDEVDPTLPPVRNHSGSGGLHDPRIVEADETKRSDTQMVILYSYYLAQVIQEAILNIEVSSSPTDHWTAKRDRGRAPPLRI